MQLVNLPPAVAAVLGVAVSLAIFAGLAIFAMIGEVNRKLPEEQQVSYLIGYPGKLSDIKRKYRTLYPKGRLPTLVNLLEGLSLAAILVCALLFGIASHNL